jgi:hypothetical protein
VTGEPATACLVFQSRGDYECALVALRGAGCVLGQADPGGAFGALATSLAGAVGPGRIWIDAVRRDEARALLEAAGIPVLDESRPIVARAEQVCPHCGEALDPDGPERCGVCSGEFHWVEIDEPPVDPTGLLCHGCGYDLTGNESDRCPECGAALVDLDALVQDATGQAPLGPGPAEPPPPGGVVSSTRHVVVRVAYFLMLLAIALQVLVMLPRTLAQSTSPGRDILVALMNVAMLSLFAFILRQVSRRS